MLIRVADSVADRADLQDAVTSIFGEDATIEAVSAEQLQVAVDALVAARLLVHEAEQRGLADDPTVVAVLDSTRQAWLREQIFEQDVYGTVAEPDSAQIADLYDEWGRGEQVRGAHILLRTQASAERVLERLEAGEPFGVLAQELSVHEMSRGMGGDMGWLRRSQYPPAIADVLWELVDGQWHAAPVRTGMGWHLVASAGRRVQTLEQQRDGLVAEAQTRNRRLAAQRFIQRLRQDYEVRYHHETAAAVASLQDTLSGDRVLVSWRDGTLDLAGFLARVQDPNPVSEDTARMRRLAEGVVFDELAAVEAERRGYANQPDMRKRLRNNRLRALSERLYEAVNETSPTPQEVRAFYEEHTERFRGHPRVKVREVLVDEEATADSLYRLVAQGTASLEDMARRHSVRTDLAAKGGLWDDVNPSDPRSSKIYQAAMATGPGLYEPLKIPGGWSVFEVLEIGPGRQLSFEEARDSALRSVQGQRMERLIEQLRERYAEQIEIDLSSLSAESL